MSARGRIRQRSMRYWEDSSSHVRTADLPPQFLRPDPHRSVGGLALERTVGGAVARFEEVVVQLLWEATTASKVPRHKQGPGLCRPHSSRPSQAIRSLRDSSPIYRKVTMLKLLGSSVVTNWRFTTSAGSVEVGIVPVEAGVVSGADAVWHSNAESGRISNVKTLAGISHTKPGSGILS